MPNIFGFVVQLEWTREDMKVGGGGRDLGIRRDRVNGLSGLGGLTTSLVIVEYFGRKQPLILVQCLKLCILGFCNKIRPISHYCSSCAHEGYHIAPPQLHF